MPLSYVYFVKETFESLGDNTAVNEIEVADFRGIQRTNDPTLLCM